MSIPVAESDLVLLVADKDIEFSLKGLLGRPQALGIRQLQVTILVHSEKDPGCLLRAGEFLRPLSRRFKYAMVVFDRHGCGRDDQQRSAIEAHVERALASSGWADRCAAVVLDPELEIWVWSDSPHVDSVLGWQGRQPTLRQWLVANGFAQPGDLKPQQPKEAMALALRTVRRPRSASLFFDLATSVSTERCTDDAFRKLAQTLLQWFPA